MSNFVALYDACVLYPAPLRDLMNSHVRDCLVYDYQNLIPILTLPDPNDLHVLAAAIHSQCSVIVTYNLKDFPKKMLAQYNIEAQHPDEFILHLIDLSTELICSAAKCHQSKKALNSTTFLTFDKLTASPETPCFFLVAILINKRDEKSQSKVLVSLLRQKNIFFHEFAQSVF